MSVGQTPSRGSLITERGVTAPRVRAAGDTAGDNVAAGGSGGAAREATPGKVTGSAPSRHTWLPSTSSFFPAVLSFSPRSGKAFSLRGAAGHAHFALHAPQTLFPPSRR